MQFNLFAGASVGSEVEDRWATLDMTKSRWPYQSGTALVKKINDGSVEMGDIHLSIFAENMEFGFFTPNGLDIASTFSSKAFLLYTIYSCRCCYRLLSSSSPSPSTSSASHD